MYYNELTVEGRKNMKYDSTDLPQAVKDYLDEITDNEELCDAFYDCDIEIYDEDWVKDIEDDKAWLEDLMGPGESTYENMKPFARDGSGALWVVIDDEMIGYIGTEGECGIVAKNINEFMNIVSVYRGCLADIWDVDILESEEAFLDAAGENEENEVFDSFIEKHGFTTDLKDVYRMIISGMTVKPFLVHKATDDDYVDSYSLVGHDDGQEALEDLINRLSE